MAVLADYPSSDHSPHIIPPKKYVDKTSTISRELFFPFVLPDLKLGTHCVGSIGSIILSKLNSAYNIEVTVIMS